MQVLGKGHSSSVNQSIQQADKQSKYIDTEVEFHHILTPVVRYQRKERQARVECTNGQNRKRVLRTSSIFIQLLSQHKNNLTGQIKRHGISGE